MRSGALRLAGFLVMALGMPTLSPAIAGDPPARKGLPKSPPRSKEFQEKVNKAVDRGVAWLRTRQNAEGGYFTKWGEGETALAVLALRAGGASGEDPQILKGLDRLRRSFPTGKKFAEGNATYGAAVTLLALEFHYNSGKPAESPIPVEDQAWIAWLTDFLLRSQRAAGGFGYGADVEKADSAVNIQRPDWSDNSNSQFAILGLGAARLLGQDVPKKAWRKALDYWMGCQQATGPAVPWFEPSGKDGLLYALGTAKARGWDYEAEATMPSGSMTAGGVSSIALCRDALAGELRADPGLDARSAVALRDGLAWHGKYFAVDGNPMAFHPSGSIPLPPSPPVPPGPPGPGRPQDPPVKPPRKGKPVPPAPSVPPDEGPPSLFPEFQYYYLYGLERAGVLAGTAWVGNHDWYLEGAEYLLKAQLPDGSWKQEAPRDKKSPFAGMFAAMGEMPQVDTCFALLFLKRATTRLHTPTMARTGTATAPVSAGLDPSTGPSLKDGEFRDLLEAVFRRFLAGTPERRVETAPDFVRMGTRSIPLLILRLESEDGMTRGAAFDALRLTTGLTHGMDPAAKAEDRAKSIEAWQTWWAERGSSLVADTVAGKFREGP